MPALAIAVDLGGTQIRAALVDEQGEVTRRVAVATASAAGPAAVLEQLGSITSSVCDGVAGDRILGLGICAPGPLDTIRGNALGVPTLAGFVDFPLRRMLEERIGLPVWLENDGVAAAIGEWRFGAGRGWANVVYVTVSTGIGGGVVSDGRVLRGRQGMAGHVGHMTIFANGIACACGNGGCWEVYGSGTAFVRRARARAEADEATSLRRNIVYVDGAAVFAAAANGDALAASLVAEEADILGIGIANLLHLYSPDVVVIGGGMSANFDVLYPGVAARVRSAAMVPFRDTRIVRAELQDNSGLIGAAAIVFDAHRSGGADRPCHLPERRAEHPAAAADAS